jgi:hypothetical protein
VPVGEGYVAFVTASHAKAVIVLQPVAQLQFAPQLLVALMWRHSRFTPDVRKVSKFHEIHSRCARPAVWLKIPAGAETAADGATFQAPRLAAARVQDARGGRAARACRLE